MGLLDLFARAPGDVVYFVLVFIAVQASFFMALGQRMRQLDRTAGRYTVATLGSAIIWGVVLVGLLFAVLANQPANAILPPLERAGQWAMVLLLGWAFLTADHEEWGRPSNVVLVILLWVVVFGYFLTGVPWSSPDVRTTGFNESSYSSALSLALLLTAIAGAVLTLVNIRRVLDAPLKIIFFALIAFGAVATLTQSANGTLTEDYSGWMRLTFLGALLIVPAILYRMIVQRLEQGVLERVQEEASKPFISVQPAAAYGEAPMPADQSFALPSLGSVSERDSAPLMKALGLMLEESDPDGFPERIVNAAVNTVKADVGALLKVQDANFADVIYSYNKLLAGPTATFAISLSSQPTLVNAIERQMQRPLLPDRNEDELSDLYTRFDIEQRGPVYFQPLVRRNQSLAVLMIGMPYSGRELSNSEQEVLKGIGILGANMLAVTDAARDARVRAEGRIVQAMVRNVPPDEVSDEEVSAAWVEMQHQLEAAREQIVQLSRNVTELKIELDDERSRVAAQLGDTEEGLSATGRMLALTEEHQHLVEDREALQARLRDAEARLASATASGDQGMFQAMIDVLNREKDDLQTQRDELMSQIAELRTTSGSALPDTVRDMLQRMSEDKARLEDERLRMSTRLGEIEAQLQAFGVEGGVSGLATMVGGLYEQQAQLQSRYEALKREKEALEEGASVPAVNEEQLERLRAELANVAADREAINRQRERLRAEKDELSAKLETMKDQRTRVMAEAAAYQQELTEAHVKQAQIRVQLQRHVDERAELIASRDKLLAEKMALENDRDQLLARIEGDRERLQQLGQDGVGSLTEMIDELSAQRAQLERELSQSETRIAELENQLEVAQIHASGRSAPMDKDVADQLGNLVQEFRTPMTSIIGYVDLVLNESAGILGDMQRKFMQRVASNVKRLSSMTEDLYWLTALDTGHFRPQPAETDVIGIIEDAITNVAAQLREKDLSITFDLDDDAPPITVDGDAVNEVIGQLLTNAYLASDVGGTIAISARSQRLRMPRGDANAPQVPVLIVAVSDSGTGIAPEDQPFVFTRRYRLENPLIPGLGDTGVGLAIAKALIEAHNGEIWLETGDNGTTIFFALPYEQQPVVAVE
ncbi:MAG: hypothetical protein IT320_19345 [Anaerolineae bacterium]|nr:hypothetical protein [Anaerolineae bacterium]